MSATTLVSLEEYLATSYRPDCDYVDGALVERNVGTKDHSKLQDEILAWFRARRDVYRIVQFPEQRVRVSRTRYRIPDVCVVQLPEPDEQVFTTPPYICIEVLSPDDSFPSMQNRSDDYLAMGVPNIWVLDPASRRGWRITRDGHLEARDGILRTEDGRIEMPIADLFITRS
jgi:Uma2 family endonuclease